MPPWSRTKKKDHGTEKYLQQMIIGLLGRLEWNYIKKKLKRYNPLDRNWFSLPPWYTTLPDHKIQKKKNKKKSKSRRRRLPAVTDVLSSRSGKWMISHRQWWWSWSLLTCSNVLCPAMKRIISINFEIALPSWKSLFPHQQVYNPWRERNRNLQKVKR